MKRPKPIESLILTIRGRKVLVDADLASIYQVETRTLNQAAKRNIERFPEDFIFQLNAKGKSKVITNCDRRSEPPGMNPAVDRAGDRCYNTRVLAPASAVSCDAGSGKPVNNR